MLPIFDEMGFRGDVLCSPPMPGKVMGVVGVDIPDTKRMPGSKYGYHHYYY